MAHTRTRISLVEYGSPVDVVRVIREATGVDQAKTQALLLDAGNRAASSLGLRRNPISVEGRGTRATDFAGLIRLGPSLELEVAPSSWALMILMHLGVKISFFSPRSHGTGGFWPPKDWHHPVGLHAAAESRLWARVHRHQESLTSAVRSVARSRGCRLRGNGHTGTICARWALRCQNASVARFSG